MVCPQPPQGGARGPVLVSEEPEEAGREEGVRTFWVPHGADSFMKFLTPSLVECADMIPGFREKEKEAQEGKVGRSWWGPGRVCQAPTTYWEPRALEPRRGHSGLVLGGQMDPFYRVGD